MDFELSADQLMLQEAVRRFAGDKVALRARLWDREAHVPRDILEDLAAMGLWGITVDSDWDGVGLGALELAIVSEELARRMAALAVSVAVHNGLCAQFIERHGSREQRDRFLRPLARGDMLGGWAITDAHSAATTARRDGDDWILEGSEPLVFLGALAGIAVVMARHDDGHTAFLIERGMDGWTQRPPDDELGWRGSGFAVWNLAGVRVPPTHRLGEPGRGFEYARGVIELGQVALAAVAVGTGRGAIDAASSYAQERRQFGKSIAEFQATQWKLADMATEIEAAGLMAQRAAYLASSGRPFAHEAAMAKLLASEAARRVADHAVQIHGGFGFTADFPAERIYRDAQMASVAIGSPAALRGLIGTGVLATG